MLDRHDFVVDSQVRRLAAGEMHIGSAVLLAEGEDRLQLLALWTLWWGWHKCRSECARVGVGSNAHDYRNLVSSTAGSDRMMSRRPGRPAVKTGACSVGGSALMTSRFAGREAASAGSCSTGGSDLKMSRGVSRAASEAGSSATI